jgi:hypothetical protein
MELSDKSHTNIWDLSKNQKPLNTRIKNYRTEIRALRAPYKFSMNPTKNKNQIKYFTDSAKN